MEISKLKFDQQGLIPAIIQDQNTRQILMLGWMNAETIRLTLETGLVTFWSRSRNEIWVKGKTSRNYLHLQKLFFDCDQDSILVYVKPDGPTCHTGNTSCFYREFELTNNTEKL
jgi:phosphoribosyl-AMP cyclohydrolase